MSRHGQASPKARIHACMRAWRVRGQIRHEKKRLKLGDDRVASSAISRCKDRLAYWKVLPPTARDQGDNALMRCLFRKVALLIRTMISVNGTTMRVPDA